MSGFGSEWAQNKKLLTYSHVPLPSHACLIGQKPLVVSGPAIALLFRSPEDRNCTGIGVSICPDLHLNYAIYCCLPGRRPVCLWMLMPPASAEKKHDIPDVNKTQPQQYTLRINTVNSVACRCGWPVHRMSNRFEVMCVFGGALLFGESSRKKSGSRRRRLHLNVASTSELMNEWSIF